jgi:hypothetical protein
LDALVDIFNKCEFISFIKILVLFKEWKNIKMGKVEWKIKKEASCEFLTWEHVNYEVQIEDYFKTTKKLNNEGLNPRSAIPSHIVSNANIPNLFWTSH